MRIAVLHLLKATASARTAAAYAQAYGQHPESAEELERAQATAQRLTADESWERWW